MKYLSLTTGILVQSILTVGYTVTDITREKTLVSAAVRDRRRAQWGCNDSNDDDINWNYNNNMSDDGDNNNDDNNDNNNNNDGDNKK